jgi:SAM-dependent methyltransferase
LSRLSEALGIWRAGVRIGAATLPREPILGLKRLILPVSYWRAVEFAYALRQLTLARGTRLLDLGSPKDLAVILARTRGLEVVATDILPEAIRLSERYAAAQGRAGTGPGKVHSEPQDGRALSYPSNSFGAAVSISVLEHIPERGDTAAMRELVRVVKPGGLVVVTTPYDVSYRETFVDGSVYERVGRPGERLFFERHYDAAALEERLLRVEGTRLVNLELWGEAGLPVERLLHRLGRGRDLLSPVEALLAGLFLRPVREKERGRPLAAFFTLMKL